MSTSSPECPALLHRELGSVHYDPTWELQKSIRQGLIDGHGSDVLLTLEHSPPVVTGGRRSEAEDLLGSPGELSERGILLRKIERGGSWTWHGPGQLVAYPLVALKRWGLRVPEFVAGLEFAMLDLTDWALRQAGVDLQLHGWQLGRRPGFPGAWLRRPSGNFVKVGAVGVHFRRFVSLHGLAWNLDPDPWGFDLIHPCGLQEEVTSVRRLTEELAGQISAVPTRTEAASYLAEILPGRWTSGASLVPTHCFSVAPPLT